MLPTEKDLVMEAMARHGSFRLRVGGYCMAPLIRDGATIRIAPKELPGEISTGDIVVYFVAAKLFVHRVLWRNGENLCVDGDKGPKGRHEIHVSAVLGTVTEICNESRLRVLLRKVSRYANRF